MRRMAFLLVLLLSVPACRPNDPPAPAPVSRKKAVVVETWGAGFLEIEDGRKIVHVKGTPYEMGFQYGYLLEKDLASVVETLEAFAQGSRIPAFATGLVKLFAAIIFRPYFPADVLEEIRGIVDGAHEKNFLSLLSEEDLIFLNSLIDLGATLDLARINCTGLAVWGPRTVGGKLFQTRNVDLFVGSGLENHAIVAIHKPEGKVPYANAGWVGLLGAITAQNAHGLAISQVWAKSTDEGFGKPWGLITRQIMQEGTGVEDAVRLFRDEPHRTYGCNFVFSDRGDGRGGRPAGVSIEVTATLFAEFTDSDRREDQALWNGENYNVSLPHAVFRGDCALDPRIRARNLFSNGPTGDPRTAGAYKSRYKGQADRVLAYERAGVPIGMEEMRQISREVAIPASSLQCVVMNNSDLELWVANARIEDGKTYAAADEPYHFYDFGYYVPTADLAVTSASVRRRGTIPCTVAVENLGARRPLDLHFSLEMWGNRYDLATRASQPFPDPQGKPLEILVPLPRDVPAGTGRLVLSVRDSGTVDLVDRDEVEIEITR
ncbi:MAG: hypothetical protein HY720_01570 [Planctomycetes bacterium]|nr:hypothetical protein [Planctomycetota bacterium]